MHTSYRSDSDGAESNECQPMKSIRLCVLCGGQANSMGEPERGGYHANAHTLVCRLISFCFSSLSFGRVVSAAGPTQSLSDQSDDV